MLVVFKWCLKVKTLNLTHVLGWSGWTTSTSSKDLKREKYSGSSPEQPRKSGECSISASSSANGTAAEEELGKEDGKGDETSEVEEGVESLHSEVGHWVRCLGKKPWGKLKVEQGEDGESWNEDQEVDLVWRGSKCIYIVPVGNCCKC